MRFRDCKQANQGDSILAPGTIASALYNSQSTFVQIMKTEDFLQDSQFDAKNESVSLLKCDVEGYEIDVLEGLSSLKDMVELALVEFNHWCLSTYRQILPEEALKRICALFKYRFYHDGKEYRLISNEKDMLSFLHHNMVKANVSDIFLTNDSKNVFC